MAPNSQIAPIGRARLPLRLGLIAVNRSGNFPPPCSPTGYSYPMLDNNSQTSTTWIAHVDLDAFFASCEQRDHPEYAGQPVIVGALPGKRGVVAAASYEARQFGVHSAMPVNEAYRLCPDGIFLRPDMQKYLEASRSVFMALKAVTPTIEKASIDEAYLDISGLERLHGTLEEIGRLIKQRIRAATELSASVGIGPNRLIAKLGSDYRKPDGLTIIGPNEVIEFLTPMPVSNLRGAGPQTQKIFGHLQIRTIGELRSTRLTELARHLGERAARNFLQQANGVASSGVSTSKNRKSISKERTFQRDISAIRNLQTHLRELARDVAATARKHELAGRVIKLKVRFRDFQTVTRQVTLSGATNDERIIAKQASTLLAKGNMPNKPIRLIGIGLSYWEPIATGQNDLFATADQQQDANLLETIDDIRSKFGDGKLELGATLKKQ